ncbi:MAG TPA: NUDIX domain-containing protein, partial [Candidatus Limnocylindrales bacterium]|nr:NUDIX domain-containing protein [Candidatus Limnocylindrales bacterium]
MARLRNATATSAGGIVVRYADGRPQLVIGCRRRDRDTCTWTLPKGTPDGNETLEETALREVAEETGLKVHITRPLGSIEYTFVQSGRRI